ncbi:unnamed protein product [Peniophora sp. CBMAI 1063]|nr:unnamed protein product [Peniophora sp. CBMAI 1063]
MHAALKREVKEQMPPASAPGGCWAVVMKEGLLPGAEGYASFVSDSQPPTARRVHAERRVAWSAELCRSPLL